MERMMPNKLDRTSEELLVEELSHEFGITETELASASVICSTCTCTGADAPLDQQPI
jgi:hypothetical protein